MSLFILSSLLLASLVSAMSLTRAKGSAKQIVLSPLPRVYVYDHCPFCCRVRLAFGLKGIKHNVIFVANDDVETPTKLIGKKMTPIFEHGSLIMPESLDIIKKVDSDPTYGPINKFKPLSGREDLKNWQNKVAATNRILQRKRYTKSSLMPEFSSVDGRIAFAKNHELPGWTKDDWKKLPIEKVIELYSEPNVNEAALIEETNNSLQELDGMFYSNEHCNQDGLSLDDIDLWSRLRSLTLVRGVVWPEKLGKFMVGMSERGDIPLYTDMAF